ncbi:MAG: hypothetical protein RR840_02755 [Clostridium sp.]
MSIATKERMKKVLTILGITIAIVIKLCGVGFGSMWLFSEAKAIYNSIKSEVTYMMSFEEKEYKNVNILYNSDHVEGILLVEKYIDNAKKSVERVLGKDINNKVDLQIDYDFKRYNERSEVIDKDLSGYYSKLSKTMYIYAGDVLEDIIADSYKDGVEFGNTLQHEYGHFAIDSMLEENNIKDIPMWFEDGVCDYISGTCIDRLDKVEFTNYKDIQTVDQWNQHMLNEKKDIYYQSHYLVRKIVALKGEGVIKNIILGCRDMSFEESFNKYVGRSVESFEGEIQKEIENPKENKEHLDQCNEDIEEAMIRSLESYVKNNNINPKGYAYLSNYYYYLGNNDMAKKVINEGISKHPDDKNLIEIKEYISND